MKDRLINYFMKPVFIDFIGEVYPVRLFEFEEFRMLANKYIVSGRKWFTNIFKYPKDEFILDYYIKLCKATKDIKNTYEYIKYLEENKDKISELDIDEDMFNKASERISNDIQIVEINYTIEELEKLFSIILRKKVTYEEFSYDETTNVVDYIFHIENNDFSITKYNFEQFREMVMNQNLLFEPLTSPSEEGNRIIQDALESLQNKGISLELESICSVVSVFKGIPDEELYNYTYYRLMVDFKSIERINDNIFIYLLRSQGCDEVMPEQLCEKIDVDKNPYDGLIKKYKNNSIDSQLKQG